MKPDVSEDQTGCNQANRFLPSFHEDGKFGRSKLIKQFDEGYLQQSGIINLQLAFEIFFLQIDLTIKLQ